LKEYWKEKKSKVEINWKKEGEKLQTSWEGVSCKDPHRRSYRSFLGGKTRFELIQDNRLPIHQKRERANHQPQIVN